MNYAGPITRGDNRRRRNIELEIKTPGQCADQPRKEKNQRRHIDRMTFFRLKSSRRGNT
jgi:hypothetical protein